MMLDAHGSNTMTHRLVDTHCHLVSDKLNSDVAALVARAREQGVERIINIAYDPATVDLALAHSDAFPEVYCALGIQPHDADSFTEQEAARVEQLALEHRKVVAIGEIGLDAFYKLSTEAQQRACFERFLEVALAVDLPVVVHVRETHAAVLERLTAFARRGGRGVIHCFTGTRAEARDFLDIGFFLSFSGIVTFKNALELKEVAREVPRDRFLVETDSPYLAPVPHRGKTNEPAWTRAVCDHVAELRGESVGTIAEAAWVNAHALFTRLGSPGA
jgi:TatD DNase family protein